MEATDVAWGTLLAIVLFSSVASPARGDRLSKPRPALVVDHSNDPVIGINVTRVAAPPAPPPAVPRECTPRYMAGPGVGIPLGLGTAVTGAVFVGYGTADFELFGQRISWARNPPASIAGGSVMIAAGLTAFLYSSVKLSKNRRQRERVCGRRNEKPAWRR